MFTCSNQKRIRSAERGARNAELARPKSEVRKPKSERNSKSERRRKPGMRKRESTPHPCPGTQSRPLVRPVGPSTARIPSTASQAAEVPGRGGEGGKRGRGRRRHAELRLSGWLVCW